MHFIKKPVVVEAITFDELVAHGNAEDERRGIKRPPHQPLPWSFTYKDFAITHENDDCYLVPTLEGTMRFNRGDMLITGVEGEIYPCKASIFEATYDALDNPDLIEQERERRNFGQELVSLINRHSIENQSNTPDWILADYLLGCLRAYDMAVHYREEIAVSIEQHEGVSLDDDATG